MQRYQYIFDTDGERYHLYTSVYKKSIIDLLTTLALSPYEIYVP